MLGLLVDRCVVAGDLWVQVDQCGCCDSWSSQRRNSRDAEHVVVEAQNRVGGRLGAAGGQVDTRVLVRTDTWYGSEKAWPMWSFVTRAETSTDVVSNVQLGSVQVDVVLTGAWKHGECSVMRIPCGTMRDLLF